MTAREQAMKLIANNPRFRLVEDEQAIVIVGAKSPTKSSPHRDLVGPRRYDHLGDFFRR
jgi:hypothetical protein